MGPHVTKRRKLSHLPELASAKTLEGSTVESDAPKVDLTVWTSKGGSQYKTPPIETTMSNAMAGSNSIYNTSMFQMQMEELISEVQPKFGKRMEILEKVLRNLTEVIDKIPAREPSPVADAEKSLRTEYNLSIPFPHPRPQADAKCTLAYEKPANIDIVGSYVRNTMVKSDKPLVVDMAIIMPSVIFQEKDYLNYRYFYKRAYYLACIAAGIEESNICKFSAHYSYQNDCLLQPILLLAPIKDGSDHDFSDAKCTIRLILGPENKTFFENKTLPWRNCLRATLNEGDLCSTKKLSTPIYNATLRAECSIGSYLKLLHDASTVSNGFKGACVLGATWLHQRGFGTGIRQGGFGAFELAATLSLLLQNGLKGKPILSVGYSSYQLFKALLQLLASRDLTHQPLLLFVDHMKYSGVPKSDTPLLFDGDRSLNLLYKMTVFSYNELRWEASMSLKTLNNVRFDQFQPTFICKVNNSVLRFDDLLRVVIPKSWKTCPKYVDSIDTTVDFCTKLHEILHRGLGDRVDVIHLKAPQYGMWPTRESNPQENYEPMVLVGLTKNASQATRTVDHGPPAEDRIAAASFRKFWGEKAELRRFKDGSILESLIWSEKSSRRSTCEEIIVYVVGRHLGQEVAESIEFPTKCFDELLPTSPGSSSLLALNEPLQTSYNDLEKRIRDIQGLPLQIRQISGSCADLRYVSVSQHTLNMPMDVVVQFEASARWPEDIQAVQRTKIAFLLKMGELLEASMSGLVTRLGLENDWQRMHNMAFLDVVYPNNIPFRLRIHHDREIVLLDRQLKDKTANPRSREQAAIAISAHKRTFTQAPSHTQALRTLCTRFPFLSPSIQLMKRWLNSHFLYPHIKDELIELLVVHTFVGPHPWPAPGSIRTGFLRTLFSIAKWDWRSEPLIVDLDGAMTPDDVTAIYTRFEAWRKIDPAMNRTVVFAASNLDPNGVTWTDQGPTKMVATRLTSLARAANSLVKEQGLDVDPRLLFTHSLSDYDFVIRLDDTFCEGRRGREKKKSYFKNLQISSNQDSGLVGYNPIWLFVKEVQRVYGDSIVLFYDPAEMSVIAGLWSPHTSSRAWKVNLAYSTAPMLDGETTKGDNGPKVTINKTAILNDIARLGGDMVTAVERHE